MSSVVVEFEGFQVNKHEFIIKELAFYAVEHEYHSRWTFLPPYSCEKLSDKHRKTFAWLTRYCHGLQWEGGGELPFSALQLILSSLFISYKTIYTKGLEKTKFLEKMSGRKIFNLNDFNCPKLGDLESLIVKCPDHASYFNQCALRKAHAYGMFIRENLCPTRVICNQNVNRGTSEIAV